MNPGGSLRHWLALAAAAVIVLSCGKFVSGCADQDGSYTTTVSRATSTDEIVSSSEVTPTTLMSTTTTKPWADQPVKALYVASSIGYDQASLAPLIEIADETEVNALVIDVKDAAGRLTYEADVPLVREFSLDDARIADVDALVAMLEEHHIIPVAHVVCFADSALAGVRPDLAVKSKATGENWQDPKGLGYLDPYNQQVWEYLTGIAEDAARHGFREVQFDFVQFPTAPSIEDAVYPAENGTKEDAVAAFLGFARTRLQQLGVPVSVSVFGHVAQADYKDHAITGQRLEKIATNVDVVCPFVYPSHYPAGAYGFDQPGAHPQEVVSSILKEWVARLAGTGATVRPWLQAFSFASSPYGAVEIRAQIQAATDEGSKGWALWNQKGEYPADAFASE